MQRTPKKELAGVMEGETLREVRSNRRSRDYGSWAILLSGKGLCRTIAYRIEMSKKMENNTQCIKMRTVERRREN